MKILIDSGPLSSGDAVRGIGVYARELIKVFETREYKNLQIFVKDLKKEDLSEYDVVHFTQFKPFSISLPFSKPKNTKFIITIYDLIPLIYPKHYPPGTRGLINFSINKHLIKKNIDAIITISETSKKDICRFLGVDPNIVHVICLAPRSVFKKIVNTIILYSIEVQYKLPEKFALYVGDINYNKNIPVMIRACKVAKIPLVICGKQAVETDSMDLTHPELTHLKNIDWSGVIRLGFISDENLVKIYNLASVYIQPSLYEGFGLPLLEANAVGMPVVAAKTQALVEVGEEGALFTDPKSPEDFADKIKIVLNNSQIRHKLINSGLKNAAKYSWRKTAKETAEVYKSL